MISFIVYYQKVNHTFIYNKEKYHSIFFYWAIESRSDQVDRLCWLTESVFLRLTKSALLSSSVLIF